MNRNDLYSSFNEIDDDILERSDRINSKSKENAQIVILWHRSLVAFVVTILMIILSVGAAMAASPAFRELVFQFFQIDQVQTIPESSMNSAIAVDTMFAEPSVAIGNRIQGKHVHTPVSTLAQNGVFLICTDDVHTKQGSHYDAYVEKQGEFIKLSEHTFAQNYALHGVTFCVRFDWVEYDNKVIVTWIDENAAFKIPENAGNSSALLIQLIFTSANDNGDNTESYYPVLLNLCTGELTDILSETGATKLKEIGNSAISEDFTKMLLCNTEKDGYTLYYVDLTTKQMYSLDELSGEKVDSCSLIENTLACWSLTEEYYKAWNIDLATFQRTELFDSVFNAATSKVEAGIVFMMGFDSWVHEGTVYTGSAFALEVDKAQNVFVIDLATGKKAPIEGCTWIADVQQIPCPDGKKLLLTACPDWQDYTYVGVLDFEKLTYTAFSRENQQNEHLADWFNNTTVVICGEISTESLCSDYYLYHFQAE